MGEKEVMELDSPSSSAGGRVASNEETAKCRKIPSTSFLIGLRAQKLPELSSPKYQYPKGTPAGTLSFIIIMELSYPSSSAGEGVVIDEKSPRSIGP